METRPAESNYFMDLTRTYPKSPKETLLGLVHLPRMIEKAKAFKENNLGEYIYPCPLDKLLLNFFIVDYEEFAKKTTSLNGQKLTKWLEEKSQNRTDSEKQFINRQILERKPDSDDRMKYFMEVRDKINLSQTDVSTWVGLLDLEEGRL